MFYFYYIVAGVQKILEMKSEYVLSYVVIKFLGYLTDHLAHSMKFYCLANDRNVFDR